MKTRASTAVWEPATRVALDLVSDAVLVMDVDLAIVYANTEACRLLGRAAADLIGSDPRTALGDHYDTADQEAVWSRIRAGRTWHGILTPSAQSGAGASLDVVIAPVVTGGDVTGGVAVVRDLTEERRRDADHSAMVTVMSGVLPAATVEETAHALCEAIHGIDWVGGAMILLMPGPDDLIHVTSVGPPIPGFDYGAPIPLEQLEALRAMIEAGPWLLDLHSDLARQLLEPELVDAMTTLGITATAYAAMRSEGEFTGVLSIASLDPDGAAILASHLPSLEQLGALSGAIVGRQVMDFVQETETRTRIRRIIDESLLRIAFQPIVRLADGEIVGFEALARFDDGTRPDVCVAQAHEVGLGLELELACARAALAAAETLPGTATVTINLSPGAVLANEATGLLAESTRDTVVEITEHVVIADYDAVRSAIRQRDHLRIAVDDAGAGFASLRHILELQPDYVKLDIGLVRDIQDDPARSAMVAGMVHFAAATGTRLIAEGVETTQEASTLVELGVEFAQGYLYGRPAFLD